MDLWYRFVVPTGTKGRKTAPQEGGTWPFLAKSNALETDEPTHASGLLIADERRQAAAAGTRRRRAPPPPCAAGRRLPLRLHLRAPPAAACPRGRRAPRPPRRHRRHPPGWIFLPPSLPPPAAGRRLPACPAALPSPTGAPPLHLGKPQVMKNCIVLSIDHEKDEPADLGMCFVLSEN